MEDTYVYVSVKLTLSPGQTEGSIREIVQEMDYSFVHDDIIEHEIIDILDTQLPDEETLNLFDSQAENREYVDPFNTFELMDKG